MLIQQTTKRSRKGSWIMIYTPISIPNMVKWNFQNHMLPFAANKLVKLRRWAARGSVKRNVRKDSALWWDASPLEGSRARGDERGDVRGGFGRKAGIGPEWSYGLKSPPTESAN